MIHARHGKIKKQTSITFQSMIFDLNNHKASEYHPARNIQLAEKNPIDNASDNEIGSKFEPPKSA